MYLSALLAATSVLAEVKQAQEEGRPYVKPLVELPKMPEPDPKAGCGMFAVLAFILGMSL